MTIRIIRAFFVVACSILGATWGYYIANFLQGQTTLWQWIVGGGLVGSTTAILVMVLLRFVTQDIFEMLAPASILTVLAIVMGYGLSRYVQMFLQLDETIGLFVTTTFILIFCFAGIFLGLTRASLWESLVSAVSRHSGGPVSSKVVDTSVIIDGRIADICKTGFIEGELIVPRFVLQELQHIADSSDVLRRAKGRRGLDILKHLQEPDSGVTVRIIEEDPKDVAEVDGKLVRIARDYGSSIVTNDFNLNKVAQIEGVKVLNINDLANALKPAVLPDEQMEVKIIKEGKEPYQGVGYLDDGTMVVVDGGKEYIGDKVAVVVTSVLQTAAGRMIFGKLTGVTA